jgi:hypothetical protein
MKIMEPGGHTLRPEAQMWLGILLALMFLYAVVTNILRPTKTIDGIDALFALAGVPLWSIVAWLGYRKARSR